LLSCRLSLGMPYTIGKQDIWCGRQVSMIDTLVMSKCLNPDRFPGHSLDALGKKVGVEKIEFRKHLPADIRFKDFAADMVYYNIWDSKVNTRVYLDYLLPEKEKDNWNWEDALYLEKMVAYIVTMASHRGFDFDTELAKENLKELDQMMAEIEAKILPVLPKKPITKTEIGRA